LLRYPAPLVSLELQQDFNTHEKLGEL
jgi:hypothetical protein